jgi:spermidine/putrescine transport system substrate-binding protein
MCPPVYSKPRGPTKTTKLGWLLAAILAAVAVGWLIACAPPALSLSPTPIPPIEELVLYNWTDYMPQSVLDAFQAEYGIHVTYLTYEAMEEGVANIRSGQVVYDVAVVEQDTVPGLVTNGLLADIDYSRVPNFKYISANFRDLAFDPGNRHYVPYNWGTTGLVVRDDLVEAPVMRWADLWDPRYAGHIALRHQPTELISVALKSLGYPLNSEDPAALEAALQRLLELKPAAFFVGTEADSAVPYLVNGQAVVLVGWSEDALAAQEQNPAIRYILPEEGGMIWGDGFVISARSPRQHAAELLLNYLLRPEISAEIVNQYHYATANEAAHAFIGPEIRDNPIIFPPREDIQRAEWYLPLSPQGEKLYADVWERFLAAGQ